MPSLITALTLNADTPAPAEGHCNIIFQSDGGEPQANISAFDPLLIGDTGSGGYPGNVPAPAAGDAAAGKFLKADGTWQVPSGSDSAYGFTSGNNGNGHWVKDPIGHIHQWGTVNTDIDGGQVYVSFPAPFTNSGSIGVTVTTKSSTDRITFIVDGTVSTTGFTVSNNGSSGYACWQADGY